MSSNSRIKIRIPKNIYDSMQIDLRRAHEFSSERVGFLYTRSKTLSNDVIIITAYAYVPVRDENYIDDASVGARINSDAIRHAMQKAYTEQSGCFHVHLHDHEGVPSPGTTDRKELPGVVRSLSNVSAEANGFLILSENSFFASVKVHNAKTLLTPEVISVVGYPMLFTFPGKMPTRTQRRFSRQSFLGPNSQFLFENVRIGIIGYGGGGSHIGQQLAHIGFKKIVVFDDDKLEDTNMNRLIGAWLSDIRKATKKIKIAERVIKNILPNAEVVLIDDQWEKQPEHLQECDIVVGAIDSFLGRDRLEAECRRYLIPFIDIGMDVNPVENHAPIMSGQVILSMQGMHCMHCMGFLTQEKLSREAAKYGDVGERPQVVWANGTLASSLIGVLIDLVTGWTGRTNRLVYLSYHGNMQTLTNHRRLDHLPMHCLHYPLEQVGPPIFKTL